MLMNYNLNSLNQHIEIRGDICLLPPTLTHIQHTSIWRPLLPTQSNHANAQYATEKQKIKTKDTKIYIFEIRSLNSILRA